MHLLMWRLRSDRSLRGSKWIVHISSSNYESSTFPLTLSPQWNFKNVGLLVKIKAGCRTWEWITDRKAFLSYTELVASLQRISRPVAWISHLWIYLILLLLKRFIMLIPRKRPICFSTFACLHSIPPPGSENRRNCKTTGETFK